MPVTVPGPTTTAAIRAIAALLACLLVATGGATSAATSAHPAARVPAAGVAAGVVAAAPAVQEHPVAAYRWPLDGRVEVVRGFDPPTRRWHPGHRGVDLAAAPGAVVRAAGPGVVRFADVVVDRGVVSIDHRGGLRTTYEPVTPTVAAGDRVAAGDPIGVLAPGHAGCPRGSCLHWGLRQGEFYLDPLALLGLGRTRLLPHPTPRHPRRPTSRRSRDCSRGLISTHVNNP